MTPRRRIMRALLGGLLVLVAGCAPFVLASGKQSIPERQFEIMVPDGWFRVMRGDGAELLVITRDGLLLQQIVIGRFAVEKELKFTKRRFDEKLPPHEVAEIELDNMRSNPEAHNFSVEENVPATICGHQGYKLVYTWALKGGYRLKRVHYGFLDDKWVYRIIFQAAARYYFDRDLPVFENMRESFRLTGTRA